MRILAQMLLTFLLNASWQVSLIVTFAVVCDWLLRGVSARYRHLLWVITLLACIAMPVLSSVRFARETVARQSSMTPDFARPTVTSRILTPGVEIATRSPEPSDGAATYERKPAAASSSINVNPKLALLLTVLYALLLLWRIVSLFRAWHRTRVIVKSAFACDFSDLFQATLDDCQSVIRSGPFRILCSGEVPVPVTVGVFRRIIILPQRFVREVNQDVLRSAIGHELVHVARRDYLTNLIYEFIYVPLSFHPAAAFVRRRIKHTRELCCDETVAAKLIQPDVYARSLISLIGSAPIWRPLAADTTIGINESDILEVRIMSLLKTTKFSPRRRTLLLIAASLLLVMPCIAAARFALSFDAAGQEPGKLELQRKEDAESRERREKRVEQERMVVELMQQADALKEKARRTTAAERAEIEAKLREVELNLVEHKRALEQSELTKERVAVLMSNSEEDQARLRESKELESEQRLEAQSRKARLIYHTEPSYPPDAREKKIEGAVVLRFTVNHEGVPQSIQVKKSLYPSLDQAAVEAVSKWRFEPAMKDGQPVSMWLEAEVNFNLNQEPMRGEAITRDGRTEYQGQEFKMRRNSEAERRTEEELEVKQRAELARQAKISMDQAIQIATSKVPGKVMECNLVGERSPAPGELAKPSQVLYHVVILSGDETTPVTYHVLVNALDGSVVRADKEERRRERSEYRSGDDDKNIEGGVLNGKAVSLPAPIYPAIARAAHAEGAVLVRVTIDEGGNIIEAQAVSGHPLLQAAAVSAAREARFTPTRLEGKPVQVRGSLVYNFVAQ